jgi:hypothetical protein
VTIAVCAGLHLDPVTKRKTLLGVYPHVVADSFPYTLPRLWLYVPFTGAQGMLTILLRVRSPDGAPLHEAVAEATCGDPESNYEMAAPLASPDIMPYNRSQASLAATGRRRCCPNSSARTTNTTNPKTSSRTSWTRKNPRAAARTW